MSTPSRKKIIIPFLILLFPVVFWLVLITGKNQFRTLPYYGPAQISEKGDTLYHKVGSFRLMNQDSVWVSDEDLKDKFIVANFFFTSCKTICPEMNVQISRLIHKTGSESDVHFLSFTVDPETDNVQTLADYAGKLNADNTRWWFLTGGKDSIYTIAREGFLVSAAPTPDAHDFFHSQDLILLDKKRHIRAYADGTSHLDVDSLFQKIKLLRFEESKPN